MTQTVEKSSLPPASSRYLTAAQWWDDVAFVSFDRLPGRKSPGVPISDLAPDLAVEVLSDSNTRREMENKLQEYFNAGTRLVWYVDLKTRSVEV